MRHNRKSDVNLPHHPGVFPAFCTDVVCLVTYYLVIGCHFCFSE